MAGLHPAGAGPEVVEGVGQGPLHCFGIPGQVHEGEGERQVEAVAGQVRADGVGFEVHLAEQHGVVGFGQAAPSLEDGQ